MTRRMHVILDDDVLEIIKDSTGHHGSVSKTINKMIRRVGSVDEYHKIVARNEDLLERILSYIMAEFDTKLEARRVSYLAELRNEPR